MQNGQHFHMNVLAQCYPQYNQDILQYHQWKPLINVYLLLYLM